MTHRLKKVETKKLTVSELEALESRSVVNGERPLKPQRLKWMRHLFADGEFSRCEWAVCHCLETGKWYRVNGQHSSHLLRAILEGKEEDISFPEGIPLTLQHWECETEDDLIDVFDQFDVKDSSRTNDEKLNQYAAMHTDLVGVDRKFINKMLGGVEWFRRNSSNCPEDLAAVDVASAYHRGRLLNIDTVRDFVNFMYERKDATFTDWQGKTGMVARFFLTYINDADAAELLIDNLVYEAEETAQSVAKKVRAACARTGKDAGHYWKAADKYFRDISRVVHDDASRDHIKDLIREVLDESNEEEAELVGA